MALAQAVLEADRSEATLLNAELRTARSEAERLERERRAAVNPARAAYATPPTATTNTQAHYYRNYPYAYAQPYGSTLQTSSTSTFSATSPVTPTSTTNYTPYQSSGAIPVQLPVASLPALHALGIIPVPAGSLQAEGQPAPPAVLRGSTANGAMLSLEINVSLLQSAQMSGLAMVLNSLMSRTAGASYVTPTTPMSPIVNGTNSGSG